MNKGLIARKTTITSILRYSISSVAMLLSTLPAFAGDENVAAIVYGSFSQENHASAFRDQIQRELDKPLQIRASVKNNHTFYRVTGVAEANITELRKQLTIYRSGRFPNAWIYLHTRPSPTVSGNEANNGATKMLVTSADNKEPGQKMPLPAKQHTMTTPQAANHNQLVPDANPDSVRLNLHIKKGQVLRLPQYKNVDINIDGKLDEGIWSQVPGYNQMSIIVPDTLEPGRFKTETKLFYTNKGLYVGIYNEQPEATLIPRLSTRDQEITRDGNKITVDTTGEGLYGYWFGVNLGGSLIDGTVLPERAISKEWDGPWYGDATETSGGWSSEMFLPWSMMSMPDATDERNMSIFVSRKVAHLDEEWSWPALPETGSKFMSSLQPVQLRAVSPGQQFSAFPYTSAVYDKLGEETKFRVGADIFWRPSSNMQLTMGINPDFGGVESDDVVINLTAFESFFPEKRLFFLEGSEIFITTPRSSVAEQQTGSSARRTAVNFNPEPTTLVNTRRIGGAARRPSIPAGVTVKGVDLGKPTELSGAGKITGQSGAFRYGMMAAFEEDTKFHGTDSLGNRIRIDQDGRDFGVARFLYEDTQKGRRSLGWISTIVDHPDEQAIVHGIDGHYLNQTGKLKFDAQLMYSDVNGVTGKGGFGDLVYIPKQGLSHTLRVDYFDENLDVNDLGFIRRNDAINLMYMYNYSTSDLELFRGRTTQIFLSQDYNIDGLVVRSGAFFRSSWTLHNRSQIRTEFDYFPSRWDDRNSRGNGIFRIPVRLVSEVSYGTDTSKKVSFSTAAGRRQEDSGGWRTTAKAGVTFKPNDRFSFDLDINYSRRDDWLLHQGGRDFTTFDATDWQPSLSMGIFFTARQQLRFTMQWAGIRADAQEFYSVPLQKGPLELLNKTADSTSDDFTISRITAQLRYRWEIAPLSDLFVVYTRGGNLIDQDDADFDDLFHDSLNDPVLDYFVVKLRYRFGN